MTKIIWHLDSIVNTFLVLLLSYNNGISILPRDNKVNKSVNYSIIWIQKTFYLKKKYSIFPTLIKVKKKSKH